jgi:hypothetical protein
VSWTKTTIQMQAARLLVQWVLDAGLDPAAFRAELLAGAPRLQALWDAATPAQRQLATAAAAQVGEWTRADSWAVCRHAAADPRFRAYGPVLQDAAVFAQLHQVVEGWLAAVRRA